jgi:hypothetical protein
MAKRAAKERRGEEAEPPPDGIPQALEERRLLRSRYLAVKSQINGTGLLARASRASVPALVPPCRFRGVSFRVPFRGWVCR